MPDAAPNSIHVVRDLRELQSIRNPGVRRFDAAVLAQGPVHPRERHLVDVQQALTSFTPCRHDVGYAEAEAIAIGETEGRVVAKSGCGHGLLCDAGPHPQIMLTD